MFRSSGRTSQKTGRRARVLDHVRGRGPGDRRRDHLVAGADAEREEREVHRAVPEATASTCCASRYVGDALLEQRRSRAGRQPAGAERLRDRRDLLLADRGRLEAELGLAGPHRARSVRRPPHGEPARARRPGCPRPRAPRRPGRRRGEAARRRARARGRPAPSAPRRAPRRLDALDRAQHARRAATRKTTQACPARPWPVPGTDMSAADTGSPSAVETAARSASTPVAASHELRVVPAAEPRRELHHPRPSAPTRICVYVGPLRTPSASAAARAASTAPSSYS